MSAAYADLDWTAVYADLDWTGLSKHSHVGIKLLVSCCSPKF